MIRVTEQKSAACRVIILLAPSAVHVKQLWVPFAIDRLVDRGALEPAAPVWARRIQAGRAGAAALVMVGGSIGVNIADESVGAPAGHTSSVEQKETA